MPVSACSRAVGLASIFLQFLYLSLLDQASFSTENKRCMPGHYKALSEIISNKNMINKN